MDFEIFAIFECAEFAFVYVKQTIENFMLDYRISNTMVKKFDTVPFCMSNPYKLRGTKQSISFGVEKLDGYIVDASGIELRATGHPPPPWGRYEPI